MGRFSNAPYAYSFDKEPSSRAHDFETAVKEKLKHSKLNEVTNCDFKLQPYLIDSRFSKEERNLLTSLRSRCYSAKTNFRKLYRNDLNCRLGCDSPESQYHIFTQCTFIEIPPNVVYDNIFQNAALQKEVIKSFLSIDKRRQKLLEHVPPGESRAQAQRSKMIFRAAECHKVLC